MAKETFAAYYKFPKGELAELVYDPVENETYFMVGSGDTDKIEDIIPMPLITVGDSTVNPISPFNPMLKLVIKVPSGVEENDLKATYGLVLHYIKKYVEVPYDFAVISAVYVIMTYVYERFSVVPYLRVIGGFGSGKTRFITIVGNLVNKGMFLGGSATTAAIFRVIDEIRGTLVFDETDFRNSDMWSDITKILNGGNDKNFPVIRISTTSNGSFVPTAFNVFGPKILASREPYTDQALESRCITQRLIPQQNITQPIHLDDRVEKVAVNIRNQLLAFRLMNFHKVLIDNIEIPEIKSPRIQQTIKALASIANLIGDDVLEVVKKYGLRLEEDLQLSQRMGFDAEVLICLAEIIQVDLKNAAMRPKIYMKDIAIRYGLRFPSEYSDDKYSGQPESMYGPRLQVAPKKIGTVIRKLGISTDRDQDGIFIPAREIPRISRLVENRGITPEIIGGTKPTIKENIA